MTTTIATSATTMAAATSTTSARSERSAPGQPLSTTGWWEQYYAQSHTTYWDWYVDNELAWTKIVHAIERQYDDIVDEKSREQQLQHEEDDGGSSSNGNTANCSTSGDNGSADVLVPDVPRAWLSSLRVLHVGCGSSELTSMLYRRGCHTITNIDFSPSVVASMQHDHAAQCTHGHGPAHANADAPATTTATPAATCSVAFEEMDVRHLRYPNMSFDFVLDKGTLDCVCLDASGDASPYRMIDEIERVLAPGGTYICFSLYAHDQRIEYLSQSGATQPQQDPSSESESSTASPSIDAQPRRRTWHVSYVALPVPPLELPNQSHLFLYVCRKAPAR